MFYIVRGICTCDQCDLAFCALQLTTPLMCSSILLCLFASKHDINGIRLNYSTVSSNKFKYINMSSSSFVWASSFIHCLTAPDFGAGVEQPFGCFIVQNRQAVQSVGRSMDWTLEDDMVDGLIFCATLTGRRGGHTPFIQAGAETSNTGAEAVEPGPGSTWEGHSGGMCTGVWN